MKKLLVGAFLLTSLSGFAQIKLKKDQVLNLNVKVNQNIDVDVQGTPVNTKMDMTSKMVAVVDAVNKDGYHLTAKMSKATLTMNAMGMENTMDTDVPNDNPEVQQALDKMKSRKISGTLNAATGAFTLDEMPVDKEDGLGGLNSTDASTSLYTLFFVMPKDKKVGDTWTAKASEAGMPTETNYKLESLKGNLATVSYTQKTTVKKDINNMGMEGNTDLIVSGKGSFDVDLSTGIVTKRVFNGTNSGTVSMQSMTMPVSGTFDTETTVQ